MTSTCEYRCQTREILRSITEEPSIWTFNLDRSGILKLSEIAKADWRLRCPWGYESRCLWSFLSSPQTTGLAEKAQDLLCLQISSEPDSYKYRLGRMPKVWDKLLRLSEVSNGFHTKYSDQLQLGCVFCWPQYSDLANKSSQRTQAVILYFVK